MTKANPPLKIYNDVTFVYGESSHPSLRDISNGAIERCAQEIEGRYFKHINDAVAAIRALKDKP